MYPLKIEKPTRSTQKTIGKFDLKMDLQQKRLFVTLFDKGTGKKYETNLLDINFNKVLKKHYSTTKQVFEAISNQINNPQSFNIDQGSCQIIFGSELSESTTNQRNTIFIELHDSSDEMDQLINTFQTARKQFQCNSNRSRSRISKKSFDESSILKQHKSHDNLVRGDNLARGDNISIRTLENKIKSLEEQNNKSNQTLKCILKQNNLLKNKVQQLNIKLQSISQRQKHLILQNQRLLVIVEKINQKGENKTKQISQMVLHKPSTFVQLIKPSVLTEKIKTVTQNSNKKIFSNTDRQIKISSIKSPQIQCKWGLLPNQFKLDPKTNVLEMVNTRGYWYQINGAQPLPSSGKYHYKIKIVNSLTMFIMIGIVTSDGLKEQYSWNSNESIKYYAYNGSIFVNGKSSDKNNNAIHEGCVVSVEIDFDNKSIIWYKDDKFLGSAMLNQTFLKKQIFVSVDMLMNGDQITLINR